MPVPPYQTFVDPLLRVLAEHPEGLRAGAALPDAGTGAFASKLRSLANDSAVRADRAVRPLDSLKVLASGGRVREASGQRLRHVV